MEEDWLETIVGLPPVEYLDFVMEGRRLALELREQGAKIIIALTHMRMPNAEKYASFVDLAIEIVLESHTPFYRLGKEVAEIDLVLNGHDHFYEVTIIYHPTLVGSCF